jgi:hypothetical protein
VALVARHAHDARALAGVALAVAVRVALARVGLGRAVVPRVRDAVAVQVGLDGAGLDAELDGQAPVIEQWHELLRVDALEVAAVVHEVHVGEP